MSLTRRAMVRQNSAESWDGVALSLSTARPSSATDAPILVSHELDVLQPVRPLAKNQVALDAQTQRASEQPSAQGEFTPSAEEPKMLEVVQQAVGVELGGFQAVFHIPGKSSVANTGETKSVTIDQQELPIQIIAKSVPRLDPSAYLVANFIFEGDTPLLPGEVLLSRDNIFIGRGALPLLNKGESHSLGFGADDRIKVERVETAKTKGESGFVSTLRTDLREFKTTITNLHDFEMEVQIIDRLPVSNHEDILIKLTQGSTPASVTDMDDQRGLLGWTNMLAGGETNVINFGYEVSWPKELSINRID